MERFTEVARSHLDFTLTQLKAGNAQFPDRILRFSDASVGLKTSEALSCLRSLPALGLFSSETDRIAPNFQLLQGGP